MYVMDVKLYSAVLLHAEQRNCKNTSILVNKP